MKTIVVIPTYNEQANLARLIPTLVEKSPSDLEIIVVDDNSPDKSADEVKLWQKTYPTKLYLIERPTKAGIGSAYVAGFKMALELGADYILEMDADFSHDPADIKRLINACAQGADLAIGSRRVAGGQIIGWNWRRKMMSAGAGAFARFLLNLKTKDITAGFRCFKRNTLEKIDWQNATASGYAFQEEILYQVEKAGFTIKEIPVVFLDRQEGISKLSSNDIIEFFKLIFKLKFQIYAKKTQP
ncbi:MAG: hypothetical protein A2538_01175 [Candidatus Magasanikbacteria bacterium RIFOXYD2_FULL_41_14]|uniref:Glycosyltransferase 2-like domain-containing protein n=1 Tax=Candidatus Magasanikbacteria bacterium RIFOXYD2_FULL_41_14 TaxID=1798709 RepID=A0A1F6PE04_9BACT|nr:MAG: hypothetical protein A2538_01175 [Candidatus Magasanikbacteria bacterium RIFOXYD2_FULL_41_14]